MMRIARQVFISGMLFGFLLTGCGPRYVRMELKSPASRLAEEIDEVLSDPEFGTAYWGVLIQSLESGQYLYQRNRNRGFMPASNMKLFTTAAALEKLGPDYRYVTRLFGKGEMDEGTFRGDLIIRGVGDPSITGRYHDGNPLAVFEEWAQTLLSSGIRVIDGNIIGDDNYFADEIMGDGWAWDYQSDWYAAQISALSFNDNCVDVFIEPGKEIGAPAKLTLRPITHYVRVHNRVITVRKGLGSDIRFYRKRAFNEVTISGSVEIGDEGRWDWFSVENPTLYTAYVFKEVLQKAGISVNGKAYDIDSLSGYWYEPDSVAVLAAYTSPPLRDIVKTINKVSQNLYAELLLRTLGKVFKDVGDADHGIKVVKEFLAGRGIDPRQFIMADGSGLSYLNMVTPLQISILLREMRKNPDFYESLPVAGVDGSIKNRMKDTAAEGNVHAKTGYISKARALSGYVTSKDGEEFSFVLLVNNYTTPTSKANFVQDWICERLANFSRTQFP